MRHRLRNPWIGCLLACLAAIGCAEEPSPSRDSERDNRASGANTSTPDASSHVGSNEAARDAGTSDAPGAIEASGPLYGPGPPGCGLAAAAFCDTFDAPAGRATRAGELDPRKWSAARMCNIGGPSGDGEAVAIGAATVPSCRSGLPAMVFPNADALICDGTAELQSNHLMVLVGAQNYGQNSYRVRQPFDFANRTGTIVFDAEGHNVGLLGWISIEVTEQPTPAPSFTLLQNYENGAIPENGIEIQFSNSGGTNKVGVADVLVYDNFQQIRAAALGNEAPLVDTAAGRLNHFEIKLSKNHVDVYATPASTDGLVFAPKVLLASVDINLPFSRGYVHATTHNHASLKYSNETVDAWVARWDNFGFDGPAITSGWREYEALDSLTTTSTASSKVNVGWRLADVSGGPAQSIPIHDVDITGVTRARIALENWSLRTSMTEQPIDFALNYRMNGHAWKSRKLTASELAMMAALPNAGTRSLMLDVDVADLVPGTNTLELTTSNAPMSYPPVALNIDLVLETN